MRGTGVPTRERYGVPRPSVSPPEPLFAPRVAVHVVAVLFPEAGGVGRAELDAADPLGRLPQVQAGDEAAQGPAVVRLKVLSLPLVREDAVVGDELLQRQVRREPGLAVAHH